MYSIVYYFLPTYMQIHNNPETLATMPPVRNCPRFVELTVVDGRSSYFLFMEQAVVCSVQSFTKVLFLWFALHYIFNLEYDKIVGEVGMFFQEFVFGLPCPAKKTATYLATSTDIQKLTLSEQIESNLLLISYCKQDFVEAIVLYTVETTVMYLLIV